MVPDGERSNSIRVYRADRQPPRYRCGRIFIVLVSLIIAAFLAWPIFISRTDPVITLMLAFLLAPGLAVFLYVIMSQLMVLRFLPRMRYELRDDAPYLILGGPWKTGIPYAGISSIVRKDLISDRFSSYGIPKAGALDLIYADEGTVSMYSTHLYKDVIVIRTSAGVKYGISPADPDGFLQALRQILDGRKTGNGLQ